MAFASTLENMINGYARNMGGGNVSRAVGDALHQYGISKAIEVYLSSCRSSAHNLLVKQDKPTTRINELLATIDFALIQGPLGGLIGLCFPSLIKRFPSLASLGFDFGNKDGDGSDDNQGSYSETLGNLRNLKINIEDPHKPGFWTL